jgi:hypothetical protein
LIRLFSSCIVAVLCGAAPLAAQTVALDVDLTPFGAVSAVPIDHDGDPATDAWLLTRDTVPPMARLVVVERDGTLCAEDWFNPWGGAAAHVVSVVWRQGRQVLHTQPLLPWFVRSEPHRVRIVTLDQQVCPR